MRNLVFAVGFFVLAFQMNRLNADIITTFESGTLEGWTEDTGNFDPTGSLDVVPFGNPGFAMQATDGATGGAPLVVSAPAQFTGNLSGYARIQWDEFVFDYGNANSFSTFIILRGMDGTEFGSDRTLGAVGVWQSRSAALIESDWTRLNGSGAFSDVLGDVQNFLISMDTSSLSGVVESRVDNIAIVTSVPEPSASLCLFLIGLATFPIRRRIR